MRLSTAVLQVTLGIGSVLEATIKSMPRVVLCVARFSYWSCTPTTCEFCSRQIEAGCLSI